MIVIFISNARASNFQYLTQSYPLICDSVHRPLLKQLDVKINGHTIWILSDPCAVWSSSGAARSSDPPELTHSLR